MAKSSRHDNRHIIICLPINRIIWSLMSICTLNEALQAEILDLANLLTTATKSEAFVKL
jgi:hypothetical protein